MPMKNFAVREYGLLLYEDEVEALELDEDVVNMFSDTDGEFTPFVENEESISMYDNDTFYMLPTERDTTMFSQAYSSYEELKAEIISKIGPAEKLPFDIDKRLGTFLGVSFG